MNSDKGKISVWSYKSWASLSSVSSNLHRFKWAFAQLIFSGVEQCWSYLVKSTQILRKIQTVQIFFISSLRLKLKMKSFLGSLSCIRGSLAAASLTDRTLVQLNKDGEFPFRKDSIQRCTTQYSPLRGSGSLALNFRDKSTHLKFWLILL